MNQTLGRQPRIATRIGQLLRRSRTAQAAELLVVFFPAWAVVIFGLPLFQDNALARHGLIFLANVAMMILIWCGLRLRGQSCHHLGLSFQRPSPSSAVRTVLQSLVVFAVALAAVVMGAVVMGSIFGRPEGADLSSYAYLRGNLPMFLLVLAGVYLNASFGEEVIYRAFLINRIAEMGSETRWAWWSSVLISSLVFGVIHSDWALVGIVQMGLMGLALGISYLVVRRNLWVTILAHGYADTLLIVQMYFGPL